MVKRMIKNIILVNILVFVVACTRNPQLKAVVNDFDATPRCDVTPLLTHPKDTKDTLKSKMIVLNDRIACMRDWYIYFEQKIKSYRKL